VSRKGSQGHRRRHGAGRGDRRRHESASPGSPPDLVVGLHAVRGIIDRTPARARGLYVWREDTERAALARDAERHGVAVHAGPPPDDLGSEAPHTQGVACRVAPFGYTSLDALLPRCDRPDTRLLVLDSITDARNLGAILRAAAFFAVTGVIIPRDRAADVTPVVERVARGGAAGMPIAKVVNLARTLVALEDAGVTSVGTVISDDSVELREVDAERPLAIVLGAEDRGLRRLVAERCSLRAHLSGSAAMASLNVSAFAAVALATLDRR
jgi:23S rRNA (guanosine2251-2'-O)-methyltransferase